MTFHWYLLTIFIKLQNFKEKGELKVFFTEFFFFLNILNGLDTQESQVIFSGDPIILLFICAY